MGYIYLVIALTLNAVANIILKLGSGNLKAIQEFGLIQGILKNGLLLVGLFLFALNVVFYSIALSKLPLSSAYPLMVGGGFLIITLFSILYLKEPVQLVQIFGIVLLFAGVICISAGLKS